MTRRFLVFAACVGALFACVAVAQAAAKKHTVNDSVKARVLTANSKKVVYTGTIQDKTNGVGALETESTPTSTAGKFNQLVVVFFKNGSATLKGFTTSTTDAAGNTTYAGSLSAVSGTGVFKGVKGKTKLSGKSTSADPTFATFHVTGSLTY